MQYSRHQVPDLPFTLGRFPNLSTWIGFEDNKLIVHTGKVELGQGIKTAIALIAAEELDFPIERITVRTGNTALGPDEQITAGSMSIEMSGASVRQASAEVRKLLLLEAARQFNVASERLQIEDGLVRDPDSNQVMSFDEIASNDLLNQNATGEAKPKSHRDYTRVGSTTTRLDLKAKISGEPTFIQDVAGDCLHGRVVRGPGIGYDLVDIDTGRAVSLAGVVKVVVNGDFVGVIADSENTVEEARQLLVKAANWKPREALPGNIYENLKTRADEGLLVVDGTPIEGELPERKTDAGMVRATYLKPYHLHGSIGPSAAIATFSAGRLSIKSHSQGPFILRTAISQVLEMPEDTIEVEHIENAGCYGHNGADDVALDAALLAMEVPEKTVLLKWTRQDEHTFEPMSPAMVMEMEGLLEEGRVSIWHEDVYSQTHVGRPRPQEGVSNLLASWSIEGGLPRPEPRPAMFRHVGIHRNADPYYDFDNKRIVKHLVRDMRVRTSSTRSLGAYGNVFAIESFVDELAHSAELDPFEFRLAHLNDERAVAVLTKAYETLQSYDVSIEKSDLMESELPGRGIAFARYKNQQAYAAVGVVLSVNQDTFEIRLHHATIAADAGLIIDPDCLANQLEGGFIQAASWTLKEEVTFDEFARTSIDWETYTILKFTEVPTVDIELLDHPELPSLGAGEATQGPTPAAIANAIYDATGLRIRQIPFTPERLKSTALI